MTSMNEKQSAPHLGALDERYEILGELRGDGNARRFIARRRADGFDVMIDVASADHGGENNALSHFASDAQILGRATHPLVPHVIEGRWIGRDAFAVVRERV